MGRRLLALDELISTCIGAVETEIDAARSGGSAERTIRLFSGRYLRAADNMHVYRFQVARQLPANYDDAPVIVRVSNSQIGGSVIGLDEFHVTVAVEEYLGPHVAEATLTIDLTFILVALRDRLTASRDHLDSCVAVKKAFGVDGPNIAEGKIRSDASELNEYQSSALRRSVSSDFLMVWGPPGTGKTHVLGHLLIEQALAGKTTLLVSNTNVAVDEALGKFLTLSKGKPEVEVLSRAGRFVRIGTPQRDEATSMTLERVIADVNAEVLALLGKKRAELAGLQKKEAMVLEQLAILARLSSVEQHLSSVRHTRDTALQSRRVLRKQRQDVSAQLTRAKARVTELETRRGLWGVLASVSLGSVRRQTEELARRSAQLDLEIERITTRLRKAASALEQGETSALADRQKAEAARISVADYARIESEGQGCRRDTDVLETEVSELEASLQSMRDRVVQDALLVACTCAKSVLDKAVSARRFDTVVVDESSMVSMPQALWSASLAQSRFVLFGDFRQLPPISVIDESKDAEAKRIMTSSLFEHHGLGAAEDIASDPRVVMLELQLRMQESICDLVAGPMYNGRLKTDASVQPKPDPLWIIDSSRFNAWSDKTEQYSWFNWHHAFVVVELVRQIRESLPDQQVSVLAPYRAQVELIKSLLKEAEIDCSDGISVSTVWRAQGSEARCVIFDTVCAPPFQRPGRWFKDPAGDYEGARLLNVALTRAQDRLYLVAHSEYLMRSVPGRAFSKHILDLFLRNGVPIDSSELSRNALPENPMDDGAYSVRTFPPGRVAVFNDEHFMIAFAEDLQGMPEGSRITVFSPFLNDRSVAYWGPRFRACIDRGCRVQILTRRPARQLGLFHQDGEAVQGLVDELKSLGAAVGFDNYLQGQKPMHHKLALLEFPSGIDAEPIVWKGSMNVLGHYRSEELMDRIQSRELYDRVCDLIRLADLRARLDGQSLFAQVEGILQQELHATCQTHNQAMRLRSSRGKKRTSFFMGCPTWKDTHCDQTVNVNADSLNRALQAVDARCMSDDCDRPLEARHGRAGIYFRCTAGHFANLRP